MARICQVVVLMSIFLLAVFHQQQVLGYNFDRFPQNLYKFQRSYDAPIQLREHSVPKKRRCSMTAGQDCSSQIAHDMKNLGSPYGPGKRMTSIIRILRGAV